MPYTLARDSEDVSGFDGDGHIAAKPPTTLTTGTTATPVGSAASGPGNVKNVQTKLQSAGFYTGTIDGKFYGKSMTALQQWGAKYSFPSQPRPSGYIAAAPLLGVTAADLMAADASWASKPQASTPAEPPPAYELPPGYPPPDTQKAGFMDIVSKYWYVPVALAAIAVGVMVWKKRQAKALPTGEW